jgi:transcriptional regulator with XRE-family HTH domain
MVIGGRLRILRKEKNLGLADIEKRTGLLRPYISRVENGHIVPSIKTLEKFTRALGVPLYQIFYDGEQPPTLLGLLTRTPSDDPPWSGAGKDAKFLNRLRKLLIKMDKQDWKLILHTARKLAKQ